MRKVKKLMFFLMCVALCVSVASMACCAAIPQTANTLADADEVQAIFLEYRAEIDYIEQKHFVSINVLTYDTLELIKSETILNLENEEYRFAAFMDAISIAMLKQQNAQKNAAARYGYTIMNETYTTVVSYQALKGRHIVDVPVGSSYTYSSTVSVSISSGELIEGLEISAGCSKSVSYSVSGPADGSTLSNGLPATHRTAIGVLFGSISRYEYDLVNNAGVFHITQYVVTPGTEAGVAYTFLSNIGIPTYIQRPNANNWVISYATPTAFYSAIVSEPSEIIF